MNPDYGKGQRLAELFEAFLEEVARFAGFDFKTPPHDIAAWIVGELTHRRKT